MKIDIDFLYKGIYVIAFHRFTECLYIFIIEVLFAIVGKHYFVIINKLYQSYSYKSMFFFHDSLFSKYALANIGENVPHRRSYVWVTFPFTFEVVTTYVIEQDTIKNVGHILFYLLHKR